MKIMPYDTELCLRLQLVREKSKKAFSFFLASKYGQNQNLLGPMIDELKGDVEAMPQDFLDVLEEAEEMAGVTQAEIDKIKAIAAKRFL